MLKHTLLLCLLTLNSIHSFAETRSDSYKQALAEFKAASAKKKSNITPQDKAVMKRAAAKLKTLMPSPGIKVGERAPDFKLKNAHGQTVKLFDELKKGPVVLIFYRGAWCPYCNLHLHVLQKNLHKFKQYGASLIAISPQQPDKSAEQIKKDGYGFEVLSDSHSKVMKDYRLFFEMEPEVLAIYDKFGIDLETYNGAGRTVLPVPGGFVIDQHGIVRAMQAQTDYKSRMEPEQILEALKRI